MRRILLSNKFMRSVPKSKNNPGARQRRPPDLPRIIIVGAGPCGIGAAWHLDRLSYPHWGLFEQNPYAGGLAASFRDRAGFTWDIGGHVLFSRRAIFQQFLSEIPHGGLNRIKRNTWVHTRAGWVPYPLQNNIHFLPKKDYARCQRSLNERPQKGGPPAHFRDLLISRFGPYLAHRYLIPLNQKMWSYPLTRMSTGWVPSRISPLRPNDFPQDRPQGIRSGGWGGNHHFFYPAKGGIGRIFETAANQFRPNVSYRHQARSIDIQNKRVTFTNGRCESYDALIYTGDIRALTHMISSHAGGIRRTAQRLKSNPLFVIGIGLRSKRKDPRTWMYFGARDIPFFRVTHLSNYSVRNTPGRAANGYASLLLEIRANPNRESEKRSIYRDSVAALIRCGLLNDDDRDKIVSVFMRTCPVSYPVPTLNRDPHLEFIHNYLLKHQIYSVGRFGGFRYEEGNMDAAFMQGFNAVKRILRS